MREKPMSRGDSANYKHLHVVGHPKSDKNIFVGVMRPVMDRYCWKLIIENKYFDHFSLSTSKDITTVEE